MCAGRVGQLLNYSSFGTDVGTSAPTIRSWLSVLQTSFICFQLTPHYRNFSKRLIKSPKLYFFDTGLLCYLLKIRTPEQLALHPLRGSIFENWVILEKMKQYLNQGLEAPLYFWRDTHGHEIDLIIDQGTWLDPIEIKSSSTFNESFLKNLKYFDELQQTNPAKLRGECIYGGDHSYEYKQFKISSWKEKHYSLK